MQNQTAERGGIFVRFTPFARSNTELNVILKWRCHCCPFVKEKSTTSHHRTRPGKSSSLCPFVVLPVSISISGHVEDRTIVRSF